MLPLHVSVHHLHNLHIFYNVFFVFFYPPVQLSHLQQQPNTEFAVAGIPSVFQSCSSFFFLYDFLLRRFFSSALAQPGGVVAVLHAVEGDVDDWNQALAGAEGAEQPVRIGLTQDPQDVALVEAQLTGLGGYMVT